MLPFDVVFRPGESPYREVVFAATRAIVGGTLPPGSPFPSVRELSQALRINPNTAQKVVAELTRDGLLHVQPGIGTVVAPVRRAPAEVRRRLLGEDVERLVVEARRLGVTLDELLRAVAREWDAVDGAQRTGS